MRLPVSLALIATGLAVGAATPVTPASAGGCAAPTAVLSRTPSVSPLPGGAQMEVYDTGGSGERAVHAVVVRIPAGASLRARVLTTPTLTTAAAPTTLASRDAAATVVVNGGFFDPQRAALPAGAQMVDGVLRKLSRAEQIVLAVRDDGATEFATAHLEGSVSAGGRRWVMGGLNHQALAAGVTLYTAAWGPQRHPSGLADVLVRGGRVAAVRRGRDRGLPPRRGETVLSATGAAGRQLAALRRGAAVRWDYRPVVVVRGQEVGDVHAFVGTGGRYVKDGQSHSSCSGRYGNLRPRSAVGYTADGQTLVVTASGRALRGGVRWGGATNQQMADYLRMLGCVEALGLDGGTSTTLVLRRSPGGAPVRVDRSPRDAQRPVPDAVAFELAG